MNYLAHTLLSGDSAGAVTGALLGDFVKGAIAGRFEDDVAEAILLHRAIDRFTDAHDIVRRSRMRISAPRRRFAGILVDVFYDHFLARHWSRYDAAPLHDHTRRVYAILHSRYAQLPPRLQDMLPYMAANDWLASYRDVWAVDAALRGIARRFRRFPRAAALIGAVDELQANYADIEDDFLAFFPQVTAFAAEYRRGARDVPRGQVRRHATS
jgi:acyl carrier protein phosphodiesterase